MQNRANNRKLLDWDDARHFLAVAREGQMLGAARRLGISQAKLSRRIAALEAAMGARLLDRTTRGSTMTETGRALFVAAERMEAEILGVVDSASELDDVAGTVRIGAPDGFGGAFLAPRLAGLRAEFRMRRFRPIDLTGSGPVIGLG